MRYLFVLYVIIYCLVSIRSEGIRDKVKGYFNGENFASFQKYWQGHRKSFENAILLALKDSYGRRDMNVYVRRSPDVNRLANGLYFSDKVIDILLYNVQLIKLPELTSPEVTLALASNVLRLESSLSKIIVQSQYLLFRNSSTMTTDKHQDPHTNSPFTLQQVKNNGLLAIVAEGCTLVGYTVARLNGDSVNLGYDTFRVTDCEFHIEITTYKANTPPVIASYFNPQQRDTIEKLLTRSLRLEIIPILQASMFSYVNTSLIFGSYLQKYLTPQTKIFDDTSKYMYHIVRGANKETVSRNQAAIEVPPIVISWNYTSRPISVWNFLSISNTTVYGIDSLYSAHNGGPYKLQTLKIAETLRFNTLMVRGNIYYENNTAKGTHDFVVEIRDVHVNFEQDLEAKDSISFDVASWRITEISIIELGRYIYERKVLTSLVHGYLINMIPEYLKKHLINVFTTNDLDKNTNNNHLPKSEPEDDNKQGEGSSSGEETKGDQNEEKISKQDSNKIKKAAMALAVASAIMHEKNKQMQANKLEGQEDDKEKLRNENRESIESNSAETHEDKVQKLHQRVDTESDYSIDSSDEIYEDGYTNKDTFNEIRK